MFTDGGEGDGLPIAASALSVVRGSVTSVSRTCGSGKGESVRVRPPPGARRMGSSTGRASPPFRRFVLAGLPGRGGRGISHGRRCESSVASGTAARVVQVP